MSDLNVGSFQDESLDVCVWVTDTCNRKLETAESTTYTTQGSKVGINLLTNLEYLIQFDRKYSLRPCRSVIIWMMFSATLMRGWKYQYKFAPFVMEQVSKLLLVWRLFEAWRTTLPFPLLYALCTFSLTLPHSTFYSQKNKNTVHLIMFLLATLKSCGADESC